MRSKCLIAVCCLAYCAPADAADKPNVLLVVCDDLNCDLGCYGHPLVESPNIDRLAAGGVLFERAYCQFPLCGPSRASFMCGLYSDQTLIEANRIRVRQTLPGVQTLPQLFQQHGYQSARVGKLYHYNVPADIGTQGHDDPASWDRTFNPIGRDKREESKIFSVVPGQFGAALSWMAQDGAAEEQTDGVGATRAVEMLEEYAQSGRPFFLAVGFYRPHTPYVAPKPFFDRYPLDQIRIPSTPAGYRAALPKPAQECMARQKGQRNLADELASQAIRAYYASITFVDSQVGRVLDALQRTGLADNTIVVFTSDHGYHMGEHGHYQKMTLFENAARVPLVIRLPGGGAVAGSARSPVELVDLYPTLAEACGLRPPAFLSGTSLTGVLADPAAQARSDALTKIVLGRRVSGYSLRTPRYRYTEWGEAGRDGRELYDHQTDPQELTNLAGDPAHEAAQRGLADRLRERVADARRAPQGLAQTPLADSP
ncbi:Choline-sulfatase [Pirellulimonas nuda]|uniref:Choline-sulfatase n=1 Tax=Pirellulimonas nuda TaxID=2528009 RepID=A0A518DEX6_9BACT|nr:sulfatase [Pirellulimonas nuda]QDU90035.1 Choline-sulfatase [Pirellulimonas nuda]